MSNERNHSGRVHPDRRGGLLERLPSPTSLATLGFLGVPGIVIPQLEPLEPFLLCFLFGFWPILSGFLPSIGTPDRPAPTAWIRKAEVGRVPILASTLLVQVNPFVQVKGLLQLAGQAPIYLRYRGDLPGPGDGEATGSYRLPFEGEWTVVQGSPDRRESHSWGILTQRYAYDFVVTDEDGRSYEREGEAPEDFYAWERPILAPADGVVVEASDGHRDHHRVGGWLDPIQRDPRGNWVTIDHGNGEYSTLAHLREGSVAVSEGDEVTRGERVGRCGHSGNSTEPHLHFHLTDRPSFYRGMGLPLQFENVRKRLWNVAGDGGVRDDSEETNTHDRTYVTAGERVAPAGDVNA